MLSIVFLVFWELLGPGAGAACLLPGGPSDKGHFGIMVPAVGSGGVGGLGTGNAPPHRPLCSSFGPSILPLKAGQVFAIILKTTDLKEGRVCVFPHPDTERQL